MLRTSSPATRTPYKPCSYAQQARQLHRSVMPTGEDHRKLRSYCSTLLIGVARRLDVAKETEEAA